MLDTKVKAIEQTKDYGRFEIEPLEQGWGHTLGNALRRTLLTQLGGAAATLVRIKGASHEFSALPGVKEDLVELLLNLKQINFTMTASTKKPVFVTLSESGLKEITARDLRCPAGIQVVNPEEYLAALTDEKTKLEMEILVEYSKGYRLQNEGKRKVSEIPLDASFSPVERVSYEVQETRLGRVADLNKLVVEIWTNGSIQPGQALRQAAAILAQQFSLVGAGTLAEDLVDDRISTVNNELARGSKDSRVYLEELGLSTRTVNTLKKAGIETLQELKGKKPEEIEQIKNIGPKTLELINKKIKQAVQS